MAMLRTKIPGSSLVLLALGALSGCVNDSMDTPQGAMPAADGRLIRFTAGSSSVGDVTRATTPYTGSFRVMADRTEDAGSSWTSYMPDSEATKSGSSSYWLTAISYYLPSSGTLRFYAYTSTQAASVTALSPNSGRAAGSAPAFSVSGQLANQYDLLVAGPTDVAYSATAPIAVTFTHAMAAVWFSVKDDSMDGTIGTVTIPDVSNSGTYTVGTGWGSLGSSTDYAVSYDDHDGNTELLLVIPQSLGGKTVTIQFTPTGGSQTNLTATLPTDLSLAAGYRYELQLNVSNDELTVSTASIAAWTDPYIGSTPPSEFTQTETK